MANRPDDSFDLGFELRPPFDERLDESMQRIRQNLGTIGLNEATLKMINTNPLAYRGKIEPSELSEIVLAAEEGLLTAISDTKNTIKEAALAEVSRAQE